MTNLREEVRKIFKMVYERGVADLIVLGEEGVVLQDEIRFSGGRKVE